MSLESVAAKIDCLNNNIGRYMSWLALLMVIVMCFNVISRYVLNTTLVWQQELVGYMHAILFLSTAGYTLLGDGHVRVDVFYQNFSEKRKALVNLLGTLFFLIPVCLCIAIYSGDFILNSWDILEGSSEYDGLPGLFILKSFIWFFCASMVLQGVSVICRSFDILNKSGRV
ncbi:TRAP transporter small permease subunit [Rickettsiales bacterium]|nr:TRAP transporter small permease subunit [Rickettsiales bacterium]